MEKVNHVGDPIGISQDTGCLLGENLEQYEEECADGDVCMVDILTDWLAEGTGPYGPWGPRLRLWTIVYSLRLSKNLTLLGLIVIIAPEKVSKQLKLSVDVPKLRKKLLVASKILRRVKATVIAKRLATQTIAIIMI